MRLITLSTLLWLPFPLLAQLDQKQPVDGKVNSTYIETRPLISHSGQYLYFSRREHPDNIGGEKDDQDIWRVAMDGTSAEPVNLGKSINSKKSDALVSVNNDDTEIILFNTGKFKDAPLVRIKKQGSGWGKPEEIVIEDFYNLSPYSDFYYSFDEKIIIMALKRGDSRGGQDLFFTRGRSDGTWTIPESLGGAVNSRKDDFAPFLAADGKSLFYCSYGFKGSGQADIYYSYRLDDSWKNWSPPVNLGSAINSPDEEIYVSVSADFSTIYFDSYSPKATDRNVYQMQLPESFKPKPPEPEKEEEVVLAKQKEETVKEAVEEVIAMAEPEPVQEPEPSEVAAEEAVAYVPAPKEEPLAPTVAPEKKSQAKEEKPIKYVVPVDTPLQILVEEDREKVSRNIYFASNKASFDPAFRTELEKVIAMLSSRPNSMIHLEGHADDRGVREVNIKISYERAVTVKKQLVKMGVPEERIELFWKGDTEPLASNDDEKDGRELNRRVEIYFSAN